ncbi:MAG: ABC transporter permease [Sphingobacteriales bacterium]|nr:MAG: ABC transporter permease [Sphingobacteriales bacterium]
MSEVGSRFKEARQRVIERRKETVSGLKKSFENTGNISLFAGRFFKEVFLPPYEFREFILQCYWVGYKSFPLVAITGFIMGLVLTLQSRPTLASFGAESWLPGMVSLSLIKEIGPVITGLICAGKIGSGIGAELGSMKVTEQIDAMEVSAVNPFKFLVVTRILACTFMIPLLIVFADAIGIVGSFIGANINTKVSFFLFINSAMGVIEFSDLVPAIIKSFFFGFMIGLIGTYKGYTAANGTESVGKAANSAVVSASLALFVVDMLAVQITDIFM